MVSSCAFVFFCCVLFLVWHSVLPWWKLRQSSGSVQRILDRFSLPSALCMLLFKARTIVC